MNVDLSTRIHSYTLKLAPILYALFTYIYVSTHILNMFAHVSPYAYVCVCIWQGTCTHNALDDIGIHLNVHASFPGGSLIKNPPATAGDGRDVGLIPGLGRSPGEGNGNPLQYLCLRNFMDREAWGATVCGITKELDTT